MRVFFLFLGLGIFFAGEVSASFTDLYSSRYKQSVEMLLGEGIIHGYSDNTFRPENPINRAEFLKILLETKFKTQVSVSRQASNNCFTDLPTSDTWYKVYACVGKSRNIIDGYSDGSFRAANTVNKAEAAKILYNIYFDGPVSITSPWYDGYFIQLKKKNSFFDLFNQSPSDDLTRGEMAFLIHQLNIYPSHSLFPPEVKPAQTDPQESMIFTEPTPQKTVTTPAPPQTSVSEISPLRVITMNHPGPEVTGGYISSYKQWQAASYSPDIKNHKGDTTEIQRLSQEVLNSVNNARAAAGKSRMALDSKLQSTAQNFAGHLVINAIYSHSDKLGQDPFDRAKKANIEGFVAESIVWRKRDPLTAIDWWKKSALHWKNVSNNRFTKAGVGIAQEPSGSYIVVLLQGE